jgi:hypothetical protein
MERERERERGGGRGWREKERGRDLGGRGVSIHDKIIQEKIIGKLMCKLS